VSHELRTPLTAIKGYVEAIQDGGKDKAEELDRFLDIIKAHADRLNLIITDLLLLSKIESGQIPLKQEPVALAALIDRTVGLLRHLVERKKHTVVVNIPSALPPILGDEERLGQVFSNLLDNAIKYTPDGGTITIGATSDDRMVAVSVADTGIGIPPQDLPRIFERFYRVDKARSRELGGTGLGLAIVKHLVEGHGGTVSVESPPGKGTTFCVKLPTAPMPALQSKT
jgi:two-component system phosphate regulon sensor histidine kinase PhoR